MAEPHDSRAFIRYYRKLYFTLLFLLAVSVAGPLLFPGIVWVTLITAFGVALVKANIVVQNFMHLKWERRLMRWMLMGTLMLMGLFVAGVAPDVMEHEGQLWVNEAAIAAVERGIDDGHGEGAAESEAEVAEAEPGVFSAEGTFGILCALCHGQTGDGAGPNGVGMDPAPADFTDPMFWETRDQERIFNAIRDGAESVGGSPLMVAWGNSFDDEQIRALAEYVIAFRPSPGA